MADRRDPPLKDDEVVASREYLIARSSQKVTVRLGLPRSTGAGGRYECGAEINEGGRRWVRYMNGDDALEALQLALAIIGTDLKHISEQVGDSLTWLGGTRSDLAVPTYPEFALPITSRE